MTVISFTVPGAPQGKGRPRVGRIAGQARMFTPQKTAAYEALIALAGQTAMAGRALLSGPVEMLVHIDFGIPKSYSAKKRAAALAGMIRPTTKPDSSNVLKAIEDGLNGVVYVDDVQIVEHVISKRYAETPGVRVEVWPVEQQIGGMA
jgi:Holliday junction resolvase RusA-like endonuclease